MRAPANPVSILNELLFSKVCNGRTDVAGWGDWGVVGRGRVLVFKLGQRRMSTDVLGQRG